MANMPSTAQILDEIHREFLPARETIHAGASDKADAYREFQFFNKFFLGLMEETGKTLPSEADLQRMETIAREATTRRSLIEDLRIVVSDTFAPLAQEYASAINRELSDNPYFLEYREKFYERIMRLRNVQFRGFDENETPEEIERLKRVTLMRDSLAFGSGNVAHVTFSNLEVIPRVFQDAHCRLPTNEEYEKIAKSAGPLMHCLMSTHDFIHEIVADVLRGPHGLTKKEDFNWPAYRPRYFRLEGMKLELHPDIMEPVRREIRADIERGEFDVSEPRVGCPAGKIVSAVHQWCMHSVRSVFTPNIERITLLPDSALSEEVAA